MSRKTIVIICAFSFACVVTGLTIFFNMSHVDQSNAADNNVIMVDEQTFTTEKTMEAPVIAQRPAVNAKTVFVKKIKNLPAVTTQK